MVKRILEILACITVIGSVIYLVWCGLFIKALKITDEYQKNHKR